MADKHGVIALRIELAIGFHGKRVRWQHLATTECEWLIELKKLGRNHAHRLL